MCAALPTLEQMAPLPGNYCQASQPTTCKRIFPKIIFTPKKLFTPRATKAITEGWMALEDEEEDEEEGGDSDDEKEDSDSSGETDDSELEEIFELF